MTHSPGPWIVGPDHSVGNSDYIIADIDVLAGVPDADQRAANARLIAAAPDLLAALKALDDYWSPSFPDGPTESSEPSDALLSAVKARLSSDTLEVWRFVRAAIAKAGAQP